MGDITLLPNGQLPAHLKGFAVESNSDLTQGVSLGFPILSYKGKVWHLAEGDSRELIVQDNGDPMLALEVVILKANPYIGKTYYPDGYEEGSSERPSCYSNDSIGPAADSPAPQATKCAICVHNQFGSKITENGARGKACSDFRRLAVAPAEDLEHAMLLRVPAASLKELVAYGAELNKRHVPYQALVTRVGFDHTVAYPKLSFKPVRYLDEKEVAVVREMMDSDLVNNITSVNLNPAPAAEPESAIDELGKPPAHVTQLGGQAEAAPAPKAAGRKRATTVTETEVEAAIAGQPEPAPEVQVQPVRKSTGFGGGAKAAPAPVAAVAAGDGGGATVLTAGVMAELDEALAGFDDA